MHSSRIRKITTGQKAHSLFLLSRFCFLLFFSQTATPHSWRYISAVISQSIAIASEVMLRTGLVKLCNRGKFFHSGLSFILLKVTGHFGHLCHFLQFRSITASTYQAQPHIPQELVPSARTPEGTVSVIGVERWEEERRPQTKPCSMMPYLILYKYIFYISTLHNLKRKCKTQNEINSPIHQFTNSPSSNKGSSSWSCLCYSTNHESAMALKFGG